MKKLLSIILVLGIVFAAVACGKNGGNDSQSSTQPGGTSQQQKNIEIYYLNFKPEVADVYKQIAKEYEKETGVKVKVVTAASDTYEQTLASEISKSTPPTIFQINGPVGYESWKNYCADLKDTKLYSILGDKSLAITSGDGVYGIPYVIEGYGIIYNDEILQKYFSLSNKSTDFKSVNDIDSFEKFKALVEDMQKLKDELGIKGVFSSTSFSSGNQWRWNTHLLNVPFHYEMAEAEGFDSSTLAGLAAENFGFKYSKNFKNIFDLYLENSVTDKKLIGSKSVNDSMAEFALGKSAMVQNGSWAYSEIASLDGNKVKSENIKMMPIYTGAANEQEQGICIGTENYLAINSKVSKELQEASEDFLYWLFSSEKGKKYTSEDLGFVTPFTTLSDTKFSDPLSNQVLYWSAKEDTKSIPWAFTSFPGSAFKDETGSALLEYAQGTKSWDDTVKAIKDSWTKNKSK